MKFIVEERDDCYHHVKLMTKMISNIINEMLKRKIFMIMVNLMLRSSLKTYHAIRINIIIIAKGLCTNYVIADGGVSK